MSDIVILLDESGSMNSMGQEPVQAVNVFVNEQKSVEGACKLSIYTFSNVIRCIYNQIDLRTFDKFEDYHPSGMTSLFDCIYEAVNANRDKQNVVFVIITDGNDTSSKNHNKAEISALLKSKMEQNHWNVIFLGANEDAFTASANLGVSHSYTPYSRQNMVRVMSTQSSAVSDYRKSQSQRKA